MRGPSCIHFTTRVPPQLATRSLRDALPLLQRLQGQGSAWVELNGEVVTYDLQPGNTLRVHPGHVDSSQESVQHNITTVPGIRYAMFGRDGIFLATPTGPGRVLLQSMSMPHL